MSELNEMMRPPSRIKKSIRKLREELQYVQEKQKLLEEEARYKEALERLHPSKKRQAVTALGKVLGGVQKEIRGTPAQRTARKRKLKMAIKKFKKALEDEKKRKASGKGLFSD